MLSKEIDIAINHPEHRVLVRIPNKINVTFLLQTLNLSVDQPIPVLFLRRGILHNSVRPHDTFTSLPPRCIVLQPAAETRFSFEHSLVWDGCYEITPVREVAHYQLTCIRSTTLPAGTTHVMGGLLDEIANADNGIIYVEVPTDTKFPEMGKVIGLVSSLFGRDRIRYGNIHAESADEHIAKIIENANKHNSICYEAGVGDKLRALGEIGYFSTPNIIVGPVNPTLVYSASISLKVEKSDLQGYIASISRLPVWCNLASVAYKFTL